MEFTERKKAIQLGYRMSLSDILLETCTMKKKGKQMIIDGGIRLKSLLHYYK